MKKITDLKKDLEELRMKYFEALDINHKEFVVEQDSLWNELMKKKIRKNEVITNIYQEEQNKILHLLVDELELQLKNK